MAKKKVSKKASSPAVPLDKDKDPNFIKVMGWTHVEDRTAFHANNSTFAASVTNDPNWIPAFTWIDTRNYMSANNSFQHNNAPPVGHVPETAPNVAGVINAPVSHPTSPVEAGMDVPTPASKNTQAPVEVITGTGPGNYNPFGVPEATQPGRTTPIDTTGPQHHFDTQEPVEAGAA